MAVGGTRMACRASISAETARPYSRHERGSELSASYFAEPFLPRRARTRPSRFGGGLDRQKRTFARLAGRWYARGLPKSLKSIPLERAYGRARQAKTGNYGPTGEPDRRGGGPRTGSNRHAEWAEAGAQSRHLAESRLGGRGPCEYERGGTTGGDSGDAANGEEGLADRLAAASDHLYGPDYSFG